MISQLYVNNREETVGYNVSCFDDSYVSDDDLSVEQSAQTNIKRQKMTEEERLTRWYVNDVFIAFRYFEENVLYRH